jgi:hypothetical protein
MTRMLYVLVSVIYWYVAYSVAILMAVTFAGCTAGDPACSVRRTTAVCIALALAAPGYAVLLWRLRVATKLAEARQGLRVSPQTLLAAATPALFLIAAYWGVAFLAVSVTMVMQGDCGLAGPNDAAVCLADANKAARTAWGLAGVGYVALLWRLAPRRNCTARPIAQS